MSSLGRRTKHRHSQPRVADLLAMFETVAPTKLAEEWDRVGLQVGDDEAPVTGVLVCLDPTLPVFELAYRKRLNFIWCHHPLIFRPLGEIISSQAIGKVLRMVLQHHLNVYASHTNFDAASRGMNDLLAKALRLRKVTPLKEGIGGRHTGMGRIGMLDQEMDLTEFINRVKTVLNVHALRFVGDRKSKVRTVAVCGGSGSQMIGLAKSRGADCYVTGDMKYHDALEALDLDLTVVDPGHFALENVAIPFMAEFIKRESRKMGWKIPVYSFQKGEDPFQFSPSRSTIAERF